MVTTHGSITEREESFILISAVRFFYNVIEAETAYYLFKYDLQKRKLKNIIPTPVFGREMSYLFIEEQNPF